MSITGIITIYLVLRKVVGSGFLNIYSDSLQSLSVTTLQLRP
jgi:hypothetical protein